MDFNASHVAFNAGRFSALIRKFENFPEYRDDVAACYAAIDGKNGADLVKHARDFGAACYNLRRYRQIAEFNAAEKAINEYLAENFPGVSDFALLMPVRLYFEDNAVEDERWAEILKD